MSISISGMESAIREALDEFSDRAIEGVKKATKKTASDIAKELRETSPKRTGKYAKGWTIKQTGGSSLGAEYTVYNSTKPGVAHLLEHGHRKVTRKGVVFGTAPARVHIAPVVDTAEEKFTEYIEKELGR